MEKYIKDDVIMFHNFYLKEINFHCGENMYVEVDQKSFSFFHTFI